MKTPPICITLLGPTASGKSEFAMNLAHRLGGEIISMDSTCVYKGFNIGSSKPSKRDQDLIPHHLIDILEPKEAFSAGRFVQLAEGALTDLEKRGKLPLLTGGTYFYLKALQNGMFDIPEIPSEMTENIEREFTKDDVLDTKALHQEVAKVDPVSAENIHFNDEYRLLRALVIFRATGKRLSELKPVKKEGSHRYWMKYALLLPRGELVERIRKRTEEMLKDGLVEETRALRSACPEARALSSVGYKEAVDFLDKKINESQLRTEILEKTRQLAKRQMTWLRSDPEIRFIDAGDLDRVLLEVENMKAVLGKGE